MLYVLDRSFTSRMNARQGKQRSIPGGSDVLVSRGRASSLS